MADRLFALVMYYWLQDKQASLAALWKGSKLFFPDWREQIHLAFDCIASYCFGHSVDKQPASESTLSFNLSMMHAYHSWRPTNELLSHNRCRVKHSRNKRRSGAVYFHSVHTGLHSHLHSQFRVCERRYGCFCAVSSVLTLAKVLQAPGEFWKYIWQNTFITHQICF